jgi:hypothetical protein
MLIHDCGSSLDCKESLKALHANDGSIHGGTMSTRSSLTNNVMILHAATFLLQNYTFVICLPFATIENAAQIN